MTKKITIDKAGRIIIPKPMRKALHLSPGDSLEMDFSGDDITLRPVHESAPMQKENGIWVYRTGHPLKDFSIPDWIDKEREERNRDLWR